MNTPTINVSSQDGKCKTDIPYRDLVCRFSSSHFDPIKDVTVPHRYVIQDVVLPYPGYLVEEWIRYMKGERVSRSSIEEVMEYLQPFDDSWSSIPDRTIVLEAIGGEKYKFDFIRLCRYFSFFRPLDEGGSWVFDSTEAHKVDLSAEYLSALESIMRGIVVDYRQILPVFDMFLLDCIELYKYISLKDMPIEEKFEVYDKVEKMLSETEINEIKNDIKGLYLSFCDKICGLFYVHGRKYSTKCVSDLVELYRYYNNVEQSSRCILDLQDNNLLLNFDEVKFCYYHLTYGRHETKMMKMQYIKSVLTLIAKGKNAEGKNAEGKNAEGKNDEGKNEKYDELLKYSGFDHIHHLGDKACLGAHGVISVNKLLDKLTHHSIHCSIFETKWDMVPLDLFRSALQVAVDNNNRCGIIDRLDMALAVVDVIIKKRDIVDVKKEKMDI